MNKTNRKQTSISSTTIIMAVVMTLVVFMIIASGSSFFSGDLETAKLLFGGTFTLSNIAIVGGLVAERTFAKSQCELIDRKKKNLRLIAERYNSVIFLLKQSYDNERQMLTYDPSGRQDLRNKYSAKYRKNKAEYESARQQFLNSEEQTTAEGQTMYRYWKWLVGIGATMTLVSFLYTIGSTPSAPETQSAVSPEGNYAAPEMGWNAENIPIPFLTDSTRYVSNPEMVVTPETEERLNVMLKQLDDSLGIESVVAIVKHVENEDIFGMAQGIFDKYKVGRNDRGLVVVLAYDDHKIRTHTGRALEADLTDIECSRLQQQYAIPCLKEEMPDSAMLYFTEAIYNTLQKKELPQMSLYSNNDDGSDMVGMILILCLMGFPVWAMLWFYARNRYGNNNSFGQSYLIPDPFVAAAAASSGIFIGGGGRSSGGGFGGGGFGGGSFGGGSSGGGGATSSW